MYTLKLEDFKYEINGDNLTFKELLNEKERNIKLLDKYTIDGKDYVVNKIDQCSFSFISVCDVELPNTIEIIGNSAFSRTYIKKFIAPPKVTEIPGGCFSYCEKLKDVILHDNIEKIGNNAFSYSDIQKFVIPEKVTEIPDGCFWGCNKLTDVILNDEITKIGNSAFSGTNINKFIVPKKVLKINHGCFHNCKNLEYIEIHDDIEKIGKSAFSKTKIKEIKLPKNIKEIESFTFEDCLSLNKIYLNDNLSIIQKNAFNGCKQLKLFYQNDKDIYIEKYSDLKKYGFIDTQINQIFKGYKKQIFLNDLPKDTPVDVFRTIINNFDKNPIEINNIINKLKNNELSLSEKLIVYEEIEDIKKIDQEDIDEYIKKQDEFYDIFK